MNGLYDKPSDEEIRIAALKLAIKKARDTSSQHVIDLAAQFEAYIQSGSVG